MSKIIKSEKIFRAPFHKENEDEPMLSEKALQSYNEYDPQGNLLLEISYDPEGSITEKNEYAWDAAGRLIRSVIYGDDGEILEKTEIHRDGKGNPVQEFIHYLDGSVDKVEYRYENELLKEKIQHNEDDEQESRETYDYEDGRIVLLERYDEEDRLVYQAKNTFENGVIRESRIWSSVEGETYTLVTLFNKEGRRLEECRYDEKEKMIERNLYEEDDKGRVIKVVEEDRNRKNTTELEYNDKDLLVYQVETDVHGQVVSEVHREYDSEGRIAGIDILYLDRRTGVLRRNYLLYEYEYF
jgi:YD repeat-containing protein